METYKFIVLLEVSVPAFSHEDAHEVILDTFSPGDGGGIEITDLVVKEAK